MAAVIVAAGSGSRISGEAKQFRDLGGIPVVEWSVRVFLASDEIDTVTVVIPPGRGADSTELSPAIRDRVKFVEGGESRAESVARGVRDIESAFVLVHDAARPFLTTALATRVADALRSGERAVIPCLPVADTLKRIKSGKVVATIDRSNVVGVQTPQGFESGVLCELHTAGHGESPPTDDAALAEGAGIPVATVEGERLNFKITVDDDLRLARAIADAGLVTPASVAGMSNE